MFFFLLCLVYLAHVNGVPYNSMENVIPLHNSNFTETVAKGRWIIIFFRKSCGHCVSFSKPFGQAAIYAKKWSWAVRIGAIDSEDPSNNPITWKYKIENVPTIKLLVDGNVISDIESNFDPHIFLNTIVQALIPEITKISDENKSKPTNIIVSGSSIENNARVILDYAEGLKLPMVSEVLPNANVMTVRNWSGMILARGTFEDVMQALSIMTRSNVNDIDESGKDDHAPQPMVIGNPSPMFTPVYAADIFRSLSMLLSSDVPARVEISGEDMDALKEFIGMLIQILPASAEYIEALRSLDTWLSGREATTGQEWYDQLRVAKLPIFTGDFIACKGSQPHLRGYPCGLWLFWHALTVNHLLRSSVQMASVPYPTVSATGALTLPPEDQVAHAMHRFMPRFFSCRYCAFHFALNSANVARPGESLLPLNRPAPPPSEFTWDDSVVPQLPGPPKTPWEEIIWLNQVHNRVNKRLSGSPTDDPTALKVVYPTVAVCDSCWAKDSATGELVLGGTPEAQSSLLNFLVTLYRPSSWHTVGLPPTFFSNVDAMKMHHSEFGDGRSTYSDLFTVAILSVILTAFSVIMILFISRFLWRYRRGRRNNSIA